MTWERLSPMTPEGKHVPAHLAQLAEHLQAEQEDNVRELELLRRNVEHIKEIVAMQQNYATLRRGEGNDQRGQSGGRQPAHE